MLACKHQWMSWIRQSFSVNRYLVNYAPIWNSEKLKWQKAFRGPFCNWEIWDLRFVFHLKGIQIMRRTCTNHSSIFQDYWNIFKVCIIDILIGGHHYFIILICSITFKMYYLTCSFLLHFLALYLYMHYTLLIVIFHCSLLLLSKATSIYLECWTQLSPPVNSNSAANTCICPNEIL